ncbi:hypothetical protein [Lysinibacillus sp. RC79]|uniref:hypothetical protein n=1 Tax=Lysinibacillus sp. RC79 TaxID=3156296 RepID=UPI00351493E2
MKMEECIVTSVYPERGTVRVKRVQSDGMISGELPIVFQWTLKNQTYSMPRVEEHVMCIFNDSVGYVIGAFYSEATMPPVQDENKHYIRFEDGTFVEYDLAEKVLSIKCEGNVIVQGEKILLN